MNVNTTYYDGLVQTNSLKNVRAAVLCLFTVTGISSYIAGNIFYLAGIALPALYVWLAVFFASSSNKRIREAVHWHSFSWLPLLFLLLIIIAKYRMLLFDSSIISGTQFFCTVSFYSGLFVLARILAKGSDSFEVVSCLLKSYLLYFFLNVTLWAVGVHNADVESFYAREFEPLFSFLPGRQVLPLSKGVTDSSMSGFLAAVSALLLFKNIDHYPSGRTLTGEKALYLIGSCLGVFFIILGGNRFPLLLFAFICLYAGLGLHRYKRITISICIAFLLFPFLYMLLLIPLMETGILLHLESLSRTGDPTDVLLLSNRVLIWLVEISHFLYDADLTALLLGYGYYGHNISGIVYDYAPFFSTSYNVTNDLMEVHSTILQYIIDSGIIGAFLFIILTLVFIWRVYVIEEEKRVATVLILFISIIGTSLIEVQLAQDSQAFLFFILLSTYYLSIESRSCADVM